MQARFLVCLLGLIAACSQDHGSVTEAVIGPSGGTLALPNGASLVVPAGAVDRDTTFSARIGVADNLPSAMASAGSMITFGPEGQIFAMPVTITLRSDGEPSALLTRDNAADRTWDLVHGAVFDAETGTVTARVSHFSDFVPASRPLPSDPDAGDVDAGGPATGSCTDPVAGGGCAAGEHCVLHAEDTGSDGPAIVECVAEGTGAEGDACLTAADCGAGLSCAAIAGTSSAPGEESYYYFTTFEGYFIRGGGMCLRLCSGGDWTTAGCERGGAAVDLCHGIYAGGEATGFGACYEPHVP
jgi:hypothetical protein